MKKYALLQEKGKKPNLADDNSELFAFPYSFPTGKFDYDIQHDIKLSPVKYFNQRLLNYTQLLASEADYIFYTL